MGNFWKSFRIYTIDDVEIYLDDAAACTLKPARPEAWAILCWFRECHKFLRMFNPNKIAQRLRCLHAESLFHLFTPEFLACFARALSHDCSQSRVVKQTKPGVETYLAFCHHGFMPKELKLAWLRVLHSCQDYWNELCSKLSLVVFYHSKYIVQIIWMRLSQTAVPLSSNSWDL